MHASVEPRARHVLVVLVAVLAALLAAAPAQASGTTAAGVVSGRIAFADGSWDATPWRVDVRPVDGSAVVSTPVDAAGRFEVDVPPGDYRVRAVPDQDRAGIPPMWHGETLREDEARPVTVRAGRATDGVDIVRFTGEDVPRRATVVWRPFVKGTPQVGWTLTVDPHRWVVEDDWQGEQAEVPDELLTVQWLADGRPVAGATSRTFTPTASELGRRISVRVDVDLPNTVVTNEGDATTAPTRAVARGTNALLSSRRVSGTARVGKRLTVASPRWRAPGTRTTYRWYAGGKRVPGATGRSFRPARSQKGKRLTVRLTATAPGYATTSRTTAATARVR